MRVSELRPDKSPGATILLAKDGKFFVYEPGVAVIASGDSVEAAYRNYGDVRQDYLLQLERAGVTVGRPASPMRQDVRRELMIFFAKLCIVLLVVVAVGAPAIVAIGRSFDGLATTLSGAFASAGSISLVDLTQKAADIAKDAQSLPDEKKEQLRQSIGAISREAGPFVDAWRNPPEPKSAPAK
jgi:hypothetical protein